MRYTSACAFLLTSTLLLNACTLTRPELIDTPVAPSSTEQTTQDPMPNTLQQHASEFSRQGELSDRVTIIQPLPGDTIPGSFLFEGLAPGNWFFEGYAPVVLTNWDGLILTTVGAQAQQDWMTTELVPFTAEITYELPPETPSRRLTLIFQRDNPSGLPENDAAVEFSLTAAE